jgi:predicted ester cyclase
MEPADPLLFLVCEGDPMSVEQTRAVMRRYLDSEHSDVSVMDPNVVFTVMATGQEHRGPEGVRQMLHYFYHVAFDATAETRVEMFDDEHAMVEGFFVGRHIGEFAGIPATGKHVRVPLCVVYDFEDGKIRHGRVYFETPALLHQLGVGGAA